MERRVLEQLVRQKNPSTSNAITRSLIRSLQDLEHVMEKLSEINLAVSKA